MEGLSTNCSIAVSLPTIKKYDNNSSSSFVRFLEKPKDLKFASLLSSNSLPRSMPPLSSPSSATTEAHEGDVAPENHRGSQSKTVHVKFVLQKQCLFGEQLFLVGDEPMLGLWNPLDAIPMVWSDGHIWTSELDIPVGRSIQFKIILRGLTGDSHWQPGPDRIMQAWDTPKTIIVSEDWEDAELQKITEEEELPISSSSELNVTADDTQHETVDEKSSESLEDERKPLKNEGDEMLVPGMAPSPAYKSAAVTPHVVHQKTSDASLAPDASKNCNSSQLRSEQEDTEASFKTEDEIAASNRDLLAEETITLSENPMISGDSDAREIYRSALAEGKSHQKGFESQATPEMVNYDIWWGVKAIGQLILNLGFGMNASAD